MNRIRSRPAPQDHGSLGVDAAPSAQPVYIDGSRAPVFTVYHPPTNGSGRATAALICPPFGWDEVCSYRSRRAWAEQLAAAGYPALRMSFPGTGDSGGTPRDAAQLEMWTSAVTACVRWIRVTTGAERVTVIGIGLGGLVAYLSATAGAPVDDLVLWGTPTRGRMLIRQLRAFSALEASQIFEGPEKPPPLTGDDMEAGGFLLSGQTVKAISGVDLTTLPLPEPSSRRALLFDQDGIAIDTNLRKRLEELGVSVTVAPGPGFAAMTAPPQQARAPAEVIHRTVTWMDTASRNNGGPTPSALAIGPVAARMEIADGTRVTETTFSIDQPFGQLSGVLTEPIGDSRTGLCVVLLNAGAIRRIGPSRLWVEAARRWAGRGVSTVRLDVEGIGDADGDPARYIEDAGLYVPELVPQVLAAVDALFDRGVGRRFVLGGLCAGAYWAFHAALQDSRVVSVLMVNPRALIWDPALSPARDFRAILFQPLAWRKMRREASAKRLRTLGLWLVAAPARWIERRKRLASSENAGQDPLSSALERFCQTGKGMLLLFSAHEPLHDELIRSGRAAILERSENVTIELVPVRDHTLRPSWAQHRVHAALDRALERELTMYGHPAGAGSPEADPA